MDVIDTLVIGAGHAGLAVSRCLADRGVEHVVLERGRVADRWRSARWDSFRLLSPNWLARLPGWSYQGPDPDGFATAAEFAAYLEAYATSFQAPVLEGTTVLEVRTTAGGTVGGYVVRTDRGDWTATNVVIATGYHTRARIPALAAGLSPAVTQVTPAGYRHPGLLPDGAVLVVGASASGVQLADELARAGREVLLAVGSHSRLPRRYRGHDILWWLDRTGSLDRAVDDLPNPGKGLSEPSLQLSGAGRPVDLGSLQAIGVRLTGHLTGLDRTGTDNCVARFADDLDSTVATAQVRMARVLSDVDTRAHAYPKEAVPPPIAVTAGPRRVDLRRAGIGTVVWATGFRPWYPWLSVPVLDAEGRLEHRRGVTASPGLYAIGLRFQQRRNSTFVDGARHDAAYLVDHLTTVRRGCNRGTEL